MNHVHWRSRLSTHYAHFLRATSVLLLLLLTAGIVSAQQPFTLELKNGVFDLEPDFSRAVTFTTPSTEEIADGTYFRYLQFDPIPDEMTKQQIAAAGLTMHNYLPHRTWVVEIPSGFNLYNLQSYGVRSIAKIDPLHKFSRKLFNEDYPAYALSGDYINIRVIYREGVSLPTATTMSAQDWTMTGENQAAGYKEMRVPITSLYALASERFVHYIEEVPPAPTPDDDEARGLHRTNAINTDYPSGRNYTGLGVGLAIADDGGIGPHIDIKGRVVDVNTSLGGSHGDMVSGIAMGAGNLNPRYRGHSTHATLRMYGISGYPHINEALTNLANGIHVTSTSYSQGCNEYTTDTRQGDGQIHNNPTLIHVFSAGNSSSSNCGYGATGYGNITGGYKQGKNVIATGNLNSSDVRTSSSSRGPAEDGRVKPDLCANGTNQMSTAQGNNYQVGGGTSAASPSVAGIIGQLFEAYRDLNGGTNPETALIKGALQNTAEDLGRPGPDYDHGYGRVNALRAFRVFENNTYTSGNATTGTNIGHSITVPSGVSELRVLVHWSDYEGDPAAAKALVNDLNMTLVTPGGVTYNPWVLDPTPSVAALTANATRGVDDLNNTEQVTLLSPSAGNYTVNVNGFAVPQGPQKYFVIWEFVYDEIEVTYPMGGEGYVPGETEKIRWDAFGDAGTFNVEYTTDNGSTWNTISASVSGSARFVDWNIPAGFSGQCRVRVTRGAISDESDANFTISNLPTNVTVDGACPDNVDLSWDAVAGATGYEVYMLGATHMESQGTTTGTSMNITGTNPVDEFWFAVRALGANDLASRRTIAIQKPDGIFNCVVNEDISIVQMLSPGDGILLDCYDNSAVPISLTIGNTGLNNATSFTVTAQVDGGTPVTTTLGPLAPGATVDYTFPGTIDLSAAGTYNVLVYTSYGPDENLFNDTADLNITTLSTGATTVGLFSQDLETFASCGTGSDCGTTICPLGDGWLNETNGSSDDIDWRVDAGGTPSTATGPSVDANPGTSTGNYMYLEASSGCEGEQANLVSPCIDLSGMINPIFTYAYHMFGFDQGELHVDLFDGSTWIEDIVPMVSGDQGDVWNTGSVNLSAYVGGIVNVRLRGITGTGFESDMALDDFSLADASAPPSADFAVDHVTDCAGVPFYFTDASSNFPSTWAWSFSPSTVTYLDGTSASSVNPVVSFDAIGTYTVSLTVSSGTGSDTETKTDLITITNGTSLPIAENLESQSACGTGSDCGSTLCPLTGDWSNDLADDHDWRVDAGGTTSTATGPSGDHTTGSGQYLYLETSGSCVAQTANLVSPCIDLTGTTNPIFNFWYHMYGATMGSLHVDVLSGGTWDLDVIPAVSGDQGDVWLEATANLTAYIGQTVNVRLRGITGTSFTSDMAVDDLNILDASAPPTADFVAAVTADCADESIQFTDLSAGFPATWAWTFSPSTVTFLGGTNASSQNPIVSFDATGTYSVSLTTTNGFGSDTENKVGYMNINNGLAAPYAEDLETQSSCSTAGDCGTTSCPLSNGWDNDVNGVDDDIDWRVDQGGTPSIGTGPSVDANPGTSTGNYLYIETSGSCAGQTAQLVSPCIDLTAAVSPVFTFAYHMWGGDQGSLHVDVESGGVWMSDVIPAVSGDQGDIWNTATVDLSAYNGQSIKLRIRAISGPSFESDVAIDDFNLSDSGAGCNAAVAPTGVGSSVGATSVALSWNPIPGSVGCQVRGGPLGNFGGTLNIPGTGVSGTTIPTAGLAPGTYNWYVACACQISPSLIVTPFSAVDLFDISAPRLGDLSSLQISPNPATDYLNINFSSATTAEQPLLITDLLGRVLHSETIQVNEGANTYSLGLDMLDNGYYFLQIGRGEDQIVKQFDVLK